MEEIAKLIIETAKESDNCAIAVVYNGLTVSGLDYLENYEVIALNDLAELEDTYNVVALFWRDYILRRDFDTILQKVIDSLEVFWSYYGQ
ncbi:MAG: hypothetical protein KatS3mg031_2865 [Chitinophagales bacterium]|nr:MAG: hypothetical protein KatS3mg031_2857 [Chitinophagales bacterium]GIV35330.1 MAG: hypothetical protein KatS3mg031_2865 [Chitinophagales bacterium]